MTAPKRPALLSHLGRPFSHSAVYGLADVFPSLIGRLLAPVFTRLMTPEDYGAPALLALFSSVAKIVFRLGLDGAFFRLHCDQHDAARQRLPSFGVPRVPHGFLLQVQNLADRRIRNAFVPLSEVGLYDVGYDFRHRGQVRALGLRAGLAAPSRCSRFPRPSRRSMRRS